MIKNKGYIAGSDWWINSEALSFSSIVRQSKMPDHWARNDSGHMKDIRSVLSPVNKYVFSLYPKPEILKIEKNLIIFRQRTHAEIWVEEKDKNILYALDKCHQRQFYPSENNLDVEECFRPTYKFYVPWLINKNTQVSISNIQNEDTPFYVNNKIFTSRFIDPSTPYVDTEFVDFKIKNTGNYYLKEGYGIISKGTGMYDMSVVLTNEEIGRLEEEYGQ